MDKTILEGLDLSQLNQGLAIDEVAAITQEITEDTDKPVKETKEVDDTPITGISVDEIANLTENSEEESEENQTETPAKKSEESSSSKKVKPSLLSSLASDLYKAGVFNTIEEEEIEKIESEEQLLEVIGKQIKANELADLTEDQKEYITALRSGVPHQTYAEKKHNAAVYEGIADEQIEASEQTRFELIRRSFIAEGLNAEKAKLATERAFKAGTDVEDAKQAKLDLIVFEKESLKKELETAKLNKEKQAKEETDKLSNLKAKINEKPSFIEGIKVNSQTKEAVFNSITKPVGTINNSPVNELLNRYYSDPEFQMTLHYVDHITKGLKDFTKFVAESKTTATSQLKKTIQNESGLKTGFSHVQESTQDATSKALVSALSNMKFK